jgi:ABC-type transport system substrate-binding protein
LSPLYRCRSAALGAAALLLSGCRAPDAAAAAARDGFVDARDDEPKSLDPLREADRSPRVLAYLFEGLTRERDGLIEPSLAVQWDVDPKLRRWTFHLRHDVRFHDGTPLSAAIVRASLTRALAAPRRGTPPVEQIDAPDDSTVVITLGAPFAAFAAVLAMPATAVVRDTTPLPPPAAVAGTGPWQLVRWLPGRELRFAANPAYWGGRAAMNSLVVRVRGTGSAAAFHAGEVDAITVADSEAGSWTQTDEREADLPLATSTRLWFVAINTTRGPLRDASVRRALNVAVDRASLLRQFAGGRGALATGVIPPGFAGADSTRTPFAFDTALARRLLGARRAADELHLELLAPAGAPFPALAGAIARELAGAGIEVRTLTLEPAALAARVAAGDADLVLGSWIPAFPDADGSLFPLLHSSSRGAGGNAAFYGSPEVDDLVLRARREPDDSARASLSRRADAIAFGEAPMILLYFTGELAAVQPWVSGFDEHDRWVRARVAR